MKEFSIEETILMVNHIRNQENLFDARKEYPNTISGSQWGFLCCLVATERINIKKGLKKFDF